MKTPTPAQQAARDRFRDAARHAKQILLTPERKRHYTAEAQRQNLPNAYVAAVADYLRTHAAVKVIGSLKRRIPEAAEYMHAMQPVSSTVQSNYKSVQRASLETKKVSKKVVKSVKSIQPENYAEQPQSKQKRQTVVTSVTVMNMDYYDKLKRADGVFVGVRTGKSKVTRIESTRQVWESGNYRMSSSRTVIDFE